jgi:hypothetical protein
VGFTQRAQRIAARVAKFLFIVLRVLAARGRYYYSTVTSPQPLQGRGDLLSAYRQVLRCGLPVLVSHQRPRVGGLVFVRCCLILAGDLSPASPRER